MENMCSHGPYLSSSSRKRCLEDGVDHDNTTFSFRKQQEGQGDEEEELTIETKRPRQQWVFPFAPQPDLVLTERKEHLEHVKQHVQQLTSCTTLLLFAQVQQRMEEDPVAIVSRTLDILSTSEEDTNLRLVCCRTLQTMLPLLLLGSLQLQQHHHNHVMNAIFACLERHVDCALVQLEGAKLLQRLLIEKQKSSPAKDDDEDDEEKPYSKRGLTILFQTMERHLDNVTLQCLYFDLIRRLKHANSQQGDWIEGTYAILQALERHPAVSYLQKIGLSLIAWLAEDLFCRRFIIEANAVEFIPSIMELHLLDSLVQCNAAAALCWLVHVGGGDGGRCQLDSVHIPTILNVLVLHQDNPLAFGNSVCLLCGLHDAICETPEVLQIVLRGMQIHAASPKVLEGCLRWMRFRDPMRLQDGLLTAIPAILQAVRLHPAAAHLQAQAVELLTILAGVDRLGQALLEQGAVDIVLDMLSRHRHDRRVQQGAVWFFTLSMSARPATLAFGGGFNVLETIWASLGINEEDGGDQQETAAAAELNLPDGIFVAAIADDEEEEEDSQYVS